MKRFINSNLSWIATIIGVLCTGYIAFFYFGMQGHEVYSFGTVEEPTAETEHINRTQDSSWESFFKFPDIPDTVPYRRYKTIEDSINYLKNRIENENKAALKSGMSTGLIGMYAMDTLPKEISEYNPWKPDLLYDQFNDSIHLYDLLCRTTQSKDSIAKLKAKIKLMESDFTKRKELQKELKKQLYYLTLSGYRLKDYETTFFISGAKYKLSYIHWDSVIQKGENAGKYGKYMTKEIPVRYATEDKLIMIPISKHQYKYLSVFLYTYVILLGFLTAYILLGLPIQIVLNISKGKAFSIKTIRILKQMSLIIYIYSVGSLLLPYVIHFLFRNLIPAEFQMPGLMENVFKNIYPLLIATVLFLIGKAFQKGYQIQQEQELTV